MRAYIAILKDSFREAMASRVLWVALIGIGVVLLLLAPFGLHTQKATQLRRSEVSKPAELLQSLVDGANEEKTPAAHIWSLLTEKQKTEVQQMLSPDADQQNQDRREANNRQRKVVNSINELLKNESFFDAESWTNVELSEEAKNLIAGGSLGEDSNRRLNLLALSAAFPRSIEITESNAISLGYAGGTVVDSIPLTPSQFDMIFQTAVVQVLNVFLGFFGIFASLLVTAGLIPRTFEPGEIALLLSKPVNRGWLYITKFLGGCTFTLMYSSVLVTGVWLLLGTRMNFWRIELLWCIPIYVFLFMIYFSVSALAGAIWRNSTVALSIVVVFWIGIKVTEVAKDQLEDNLIKAQGIKEITMAGDDVIVIDGDLRTRIWNAKTATWDEVFQSPPNGMPGFMTRILGSNVRVTNVYDPNSRQILSLQSGQSRFPGMAVPELVGGTAEDDWDRITLGRTPEFVNTILIDANGRILLPAEGGLYEFVGQTDRQQKRGDLLSSISGGLLGGGKAFRKVPVKGYPDLSGPIASTLNLTTNQVLIYSQGTLHLLNPTKDGDYEFATSIDLESDKQAVLAASGRHCVLALGDGRICVIDCEQMKILNTATKDSATLPRVCAAAADGSWLAVLRHDESVILFDGENGQTIAWSLPENGVCAAIATDPEGNLLVSNGRLAVRKYNVSTGEMLEEWSQQTSWVYRLYDLAIYPIWSVVPKPSQLDGFVPYVMSGEDSVIVNETRTRPGMIDRDSLQQEREAFNYSKVFLDNAVFVLVMLLLGCVYVSRSDF